MRALVTGGAGFIGSNLVDQLLDAGHAVVVFDDLSNGSRANLGRAEGTPGFALVRGDVRGPELHATVLDARPDVVYHLAAQVSVTRSVADPALDADVNVLGSLRVFSAAAAVGAKVVVATSAAIYGDVSPESLPIAESEPLHPRSPYGISKMVLLPYLAAYAELAGLRWSALALANVYGPRQNTEGEAGVVARFIAEALAGKPSRIFGDGTQTRDFVYVGDVAAAFHAAATGADGALVNVGTGLETSLNALVAALRRPLGEHWEVEHAPRRPGELARSCLDVSLAARLLGFRASVGLADGLAATVDAMRAAASR